MAETDIDRLRQHLGGVKIGAMNGDNLAITLCTHFDDPDEEIEDETCWGPSALNGANATLDAIHAYYATALTDRDAQIDRLAERCAAYKGQVEAGAAEIERLTKLSDMQALALESQAADIARLAREYDERNRVAIQRAASAASAEARATTAERDLVEARAEVERKDAALRFAIMTFDGQKQPFEASKMRAALAKGGPDGDA